MYRSSPGCKLPADARTDAMEHARRALLTALGYDETHKADVVRRPFKGIQVSDSAGGKVAFITKKQLLAFGNDERLVRRFAEETGAIARAPDPARKASS